MSRPDRDRGETATNGDERDVGETSEPVGTDGRGVADEADATGDADASDYSTVRDRRRGTTEPATTREAGAALEPNATSETIESGATGESAPRPKTDETGRSRETETTGRNRETAETTHTRTTVETGQTGATTGTNQGRSTEETNRWRAVGGLVFLAAAAALFADRAVLFLLAVVGVVYAVYPRVTGTPDPTVELDRRVDETEPADGQPVTVSVTVTNVGGRVLPDLRVVDGVPAALTVVDGSPRRGMALRPGQSSRFSYTVQAALGTHTFEPATVVARDLSGAHEVETSVDTETSLACRTLPAGARLRSQTVESIGALVTDRGGRGTEFFSTREYRVGDPPSQFDWKRYARTRERTTVQYREERAAKVVLLVDTDESAFRGRPGHPHAVTFGVAAAEELLDGLLDQRHMVGVASLGRPGCWLAPSRGSDHRVRARRLLTTHSAFAAEPPTADESPPLDRQVTELRTRLSPSTQIVFVTPLCSPDVARAARTLEATGHPVTVVSPDVTAADTVGQRLAAIQRDNAVAALRRAGVPVVEWDPERPLAAVLTETAEVSLS